jgi:hypothetical protein
MSQVACKLLRKRLVVNEFVLDVPRGETRYFPMRHRAILLN